MNRLGVKPRGTRPAPPVDIRLTDEYHEYVIPFEKEVAFSAFCGLSDGLRHLNRFATVETDDELSSSLVYTYRRFCNVFNAAFDTNDIRDYNFPTQGKIQSELNWYKKGGIPPRTITVEKTEENIRLRYENGFHATSEEVYIDAYEVDEKINDEVYACGQGITNIHSPYMPSFFEKWRYRPSRVSLSIAQEDDGIRLGIEQDKPKSPLWYGLYYYLSPINRPYAKVTLSMENQTKTVRFVKGYSE